MEHAASKCVWCWSFRTIDYVSNMTESTAAMNLKDLSPSTRQIEGPSNRAHRVKQGFYEYKSALLKGIWGSNRRSCTQHSAISPDGRHRGHLL